MFRTLANPGCSRFRGPELKMCRLGCVCCQAILLLLNHLNKVFGFVSLYYHYGKEPEEIA